MRIIYQMRKVVITESRIRSENNPLHKAEAKSEKSRFYAFSNLRKSDVLKGLLKIQRTN